MHLSSLSTLFLLRFLTFLVLPSLCTSQLPKCAQNCALDYLSSSNCPLTTKECICDYLSAYDDCVNASCNGTEVKEANKPPLPSQISISSLTVSIDSTVSCALDTPTITVPSSPVFTRTGTITRSSPGGGGESTRTGGEGNRGTTKTESLEGTPKNEETVGTSTTEGWATGTGTSTTTTSRASAQSAVSTATASSKTGSGSSTSTSSSQPAKATVKGGTERLLQNGKLQMVVIEAVVLMLAVVRI